MAQPHTPLLPGKYYHIYNRGINSCDLFRENTNYEHFQSLYSKYISPVANTLAWVLMKNHFHLLVEILPVENWGKLANSESFKDLRGEAALRELKPEKRINQQFSNLFNAYSKAFNERYRRTGSLMEHPFERKMIDNKEYLKNMIVYIHQNPVHHGICQHPSEYPWSSYKSCISLKPSKLDRAKVIACFDNTDEFIFFHNQSIQTASIDEWFELQPD